MNRPERALSYLTHETDRNLNRQRKTFLSRTPDLEVMPPLGLGKKKGTEAIDEIRELRAGDILSKLADVSEQLSKARQDYQTLQSIFLKLDEKNTAIDQKTSEMRAEMAEMKARVSEMHGTLSEMGSQLGELPQLKTKIHATQGDMQELNNAVERMSQVLDDIDKLFKYLKSPGF